MTATNKVTKKQHDEVMNAIANLRLDVAVVKTEVTELKRRVGIQNGRVADGEAAIKKILTKGDLDDGEKRGISKFWRLIGTVILVLGGVAAILGVILKIIK